MTNHKSNSAKLRTSCTSSELDRTIFLLEKAKRETDKIALLNGLNAAVKILPELSMKKQKQIMDEIRFYHKITVYTEESENILMSLKEQQSTFVVLILTCLQSIKDSISTTNNNYKLDQRFIFMIEHIFKRFVGLLMQLNWHKTGVMIRSFIASVYNITNVKYKKQKYNFELRD